MITSKDISVLRKNDFAYSYEHGVPKSTHGVFLRVRTSEIQAELNTSFKRALSSHKIQKKALYSLWIAY